MKKQRARRTNKSLFLFAVLFFLACGSDDSSTDTLRDGEFKPTRTYTVEIDWRANTEPDLAGYWLYQSKVSGRYTKSKRVLEIPAGIETCTIEHLPPGTYFWVLTAFNTSQNESDYSNEVSAIID
jgi:hypothetical protein